MMSLLIPPLLGAMLVGAAIPSATLPPWQPNACVDVSSGQLDQPNVRITEFGENRGEIIVKFRIELFRGDPAFPDRTDRGMIFVQLDAERGTYLAVRTSPEEDSAIAYTGLSKGPHRIAVQLVSAHATPPSTAIRCFSV